MNLLFKDDLILKFCKGKRVLHIGATDSPYYEDKGRNGGLLHQKLQKVCKQLIGVDVDREAINYLKKNFKICDIFYGDICKNVYDVDMDQYEFDYIVFADVIEHLENPGMALENLRGLLGKGTKLIVTTPNVFSYQNIKTYITRNELVHPDHLFWPSHKTMLRLFGAKNLKIDYFTYCFWGSCQLKTFKGRTLYRIVTASSQSLLPCLFFVVKL